MPIVSGTITTWACPDNLVDALEGGFTSSWDDGGVDDPNPRNDCSTAKDA